MKICFIGQKGIPAAFGGVERHVEELAAELVKNGHEVFVYARKWFTPKNTRIHRSINLIHLPTIHTKHLDAIFHTFISSLHAIWKKPDVIHYHGVGPALLAWIPRLLAPKIKVVTTFHCIDRYHQKWGAFARFMLWLGEKAACAFPHETISVSKTIQSYCLNEYHKKTVYNPNGVLIEKNPGEESLNKWGLEKNKYFLMVSRLVPHKGAHYLIEAWQLARQQNPHLLDGQKLVIVGGSSFTDEYVSYLKKLAVDDDSIVFTDWQSGDPLNSLYANCKMLVHPSENEGLPITVLQAMSYGRPVLVSDIPEHQEVITDGKFWFNNASIYSLAEKIAHLSQNEQLLGAAAVANLKIVRNNYQWPDIATKTGDVYESIVLKRAAKLKTA